MKTNFNYLLQAAQVYWKGYCIFFAGLILLLLGMGSLSAENPSDSGLVSDYRYEMSSKISRVHSSQVSKGVKIGSRTRPFPIVHDNHLFVFYKIKDSRQIAYFIRDINCEGDVMDCQWHGPFKIGKRAVKPTSNQEPHAVVLDNKLFVFAKTDSNTISYTYATRPAVDLTKGWYSAGIGAITDGNSHYMNKLIRTPEVIAMGEAVEFWYTIKVGSHGGASDKTGLYDVVSTQCAWSGTDFECNPRERQNYYTKNNSRKQGVKSWISVIALPNQSAALFTQNRTYSDKSSIVKEMHRSFSAFYYSAGSAWVNPSLSDNSDPLYDARLLDWKHDIVRASDRSQGPAGVFWPTIDSPDVGDIYTLVLERDNSENDLRLYRGTAADSSTNALSPWWPWKRVIVRNASGSKTKLDDVRINLPVRAVIYEDMMYVFYRERDSKLLKFFTIKRELVENN